MVCCLRLSWTEGVGLGLKLNERTVVPLGCSTTGTTLCIPNAFFKLPLICLNFGTLNSAKERIKTKNAIKRVAISAKVAIHAGAPLGGHSSHSCSSSSVVSFFFSLASSAICFNFLGCG